jgi:hypothetical protein
MGGFDQLFQQFFNQLVGIPLENTLGYVYVVLNLVALIFGGLLQFVDSGDPPETT